MIDQNDNEWLDGYDLIKLNDLYTIREPIKETTEEQFKPYFEFANSEYYNFQVLEKYKDSIKELLVSNYGNIKYNGVIIPSTLVGGGPNKGIYGGKINHYREIIFPDLPIEGYVFKTYRLVAEVWCNNPDPKIYTTVHHIGNDSYDNKNNLLFVTREQHSFIKHAEQDEIKTEDIKRKIITILICNHTFLGRYAFLEEMKASWEQEMKNVSQMPVHEITIIKPPNYFESNVILLDDEHYIVENIGLSFKVVFYDPKNEKADTEGLVRELGRCIFSIKGYYSYSDLLEIISITPVEFKYKKVPLFIDKGEYFDISDWVHYWQHFDFALPRSIAKLFGVSIKTAQQWIDSMKYPKIKNKRYKFKRKPNIAERMFPKTIITEVL